MQDNRLIVGDDSELWTDVAGYEIDEYTMLEFLGSGLRPKEARRYAEAFNRVVGEEIILILPDVQTGSVSFALQPTLETRTA
jgi:hypothetical protein